MYNLYIIYIHIQRKFSYKTSELLTIVMVSIPSIMSTNHHFFLLHFSSLTLPTSAFPSLHIVGSLASKLPLVSFGYILHCTSLMDIWHVMAPSLRHDGRVGSQGCSSRGCCADTKFEARRNGVKIRGLDPQFKWNIDGYCIKRY